MRTRRRATIWSKSPVNLLPTIVRTPSGSADSAAGSVGTSPVLADPAGLPVFAAAPAGAAVSDVAFELPRPHPANMAATNARITPADVRSPGGLMKRASVNSHPPTSNFQTDRVAAVSECLGL